MPFDHKLRKGTAGYKLTRSQEQINHLMYMDDMKLFAKKEKTTGNSYTTDTIYIQDIKIGFGIERCARRVMKSGKRHLIDVMKLQSKDKIRTFGEKEKYKYLGLLDAGMIKHVERKTKLGKNISEELESYSRQKLSSRNVFK